MNKLSIMIVGAACCTIAHIASAGVPQGTPSAPEATVVDMADLSEEFGTRYLNYLRGIYDENDPKWDDSIYEDPDLFDNDTFQKFLDVLDIEAYAIGGDIDWFKLLNDFDDYLASIDNGELDFVSGTFEKQFKKAETVSSIIYDADEMPVGTVQVKASKKSKKGMVTITATIKLFETGKKYSAKAVLAADGDSGNLSLKQPVGAMQIVLAADGAFSIGNDDYMVLAGDVGGVLDTESLTFGLESDDDLDFGDDWCLLDDITPDGTEITVKKGVKWDCGKAPSIKYKKFKEDDETWYELVGLDDENKPNVSALKLTYSYKTGEFKGSFKLYASNECADVLKPKLKTYTVSVNGIVIDGVGYGTAVLKKPNRTWRVIVE